MPLASHLQPIFAEIDRKIVDRQKAYRRAAILEMAAKYPASRASSLAKLGVPDGDHLKVASQLKLLLKVDRVLRRDNPHYAKAPLYRWSLLAAWIGERRCRKQTQALARRFMPAACIVEAA